MANYHLEKSKPEERGLPRYVALVHKEKGTVYGVSFPDFPGCISAGDTLEEALNNAKEALAFHAEGMRQDGEVIPLPMFPEAALQKAKEEGISLENAIVSLVPLFQPKGEPVRVNINIDSNLLAATDKAAKAAHQSRSAFIARVLESAIGG